MLFAADAWLAPSIAGERKVFAVSVAVGVPFSVHLTTMPWALCAGFVPAPVSGPPSCPKVFDRDVREIRLSERQRRR